MSLWRHLPIKEGVKFTYGVRRFALPQRPGWTVVRGDNAFWHLPPNVTKFFSKEMLLTFLSRADRKQKGSFLRISSCKADGRSRDCTSRGIYWTGKSGFVVQPDTVNCQTKLVQCTDCGLTGLLLEFENYPELNYLLFTKGRVTEQTFYKYMLFYSNKIYFHPVGDCAQTLKDIPYLRYEGQEQCSTINLKNTPKSLIAPSCAPTVA